MNENLSKKVNIVKGCAFSENALKVENYFLGLFLVQFSLVEWENDNSTKKKNIIKESFI